MTAQEFNSPGEHMASISNNSINGGTAYRNPNDTRSPTQIYIDRGLEYNNATGKWLNSADAIDDYLDRSNKYNQYYMRYNEGLFNKAMEYDQYMSNTAIQRQMEDLKKAGINPILAGRLGGATYKGVNVPYVNINPGSTLSAITDFYNTQSSNYYKEKNLELEREKMTQEERIADKKISAELERANLDNETLLKIAEMNNLTKQEIAELEETYKVQIQDMYNKVLLEINKNDIQSDKEINRNNVISNIIGSSVRAIGYTIGAMIIKSKMDKGDKGGNGGIGTVASTIAGRIKQANDFLRPANGNLSIPQMSITGLDIGLGIGGLAGLPILIG